MRWRLTLYTGGILVFFVGLTMILPLAVALLLQDGSAVPLATALVIAMSTGGLLYLLFRPARSDHISHREGMAIVTVSWVLTGILGALPFYLGIPGLAWVDAVFESVSGFSTTGASILTDIESVMPGLLLWRSLIQWLGGMGIIVLSVAILPFLGVGGMQLYKYEIPSPVVDKLSPRIRDTAMTLWKIYVLMSGVLLMLLLAGGMSLFDAACHTFTTMPTGGFSPRNTSIAHYNSPYFDGVFILFMLIAGINFALHYQMLTGQPLAFWRNAECRFFLGLVLLLTLVVTFNIHGRIYAGLLEALRFGAFQVVSIITTTGFGTADYARWPTLSQVILLICMFIGGSAGSTAGGMKCLRIMLVLKFCYKEFFVLIHPHAVHHVKIGGKTVSDDVMRSVLGFLALYIALFTVSAIILAGLGLDMVTAFGAVAATIGNIGPGFGAVGPAENFAGIPYLGKWLLIWCMLLGRLEIYTVMILLIPEFWRK